jgi:hypothetical protein
MAAAGRELALQGPDRSYSGRAESLRRDDNTEMQEKQRYALRSVSGNSSSVLPHEKHAITVKR